MSTTGTCHSPRMLRAAAARSGRTRRAAACRWAAAQLPGAHAGGCTWLARLEELCCERSNPAVQVFFAVLLGACYWVYVREVFSMLPLPGVPGWHL